MIKSRLSGYLTLFIVFSLICPWAQAEVQVQHAYSRPLPPGQTVASVYLEIKNLTEKQLILTSVASPVANKAEFHSHSHENGMMQMRKLEQVTLGAGKTLRFQPGDYHIMLFGVSKQLKEGDQIPLTLNTCGQEAIEVIATVKAYQ